MRPDIRVSVEKIENRVHPHFDIAIIRSVVCDYRWAQGFIEFHLLSNP